MNRIDHITDPLAFLLSMALAGAVGAAPSPLPALLSLVPALAEHIRDRDRDREEPPAAPRPRPSATQPSPA